MAKLHLKLKEQEFCLIFCSQFCKSLHELLLYWSRSEFTGTLKNPIVLTAFYKTRSKSASFSYKEMCWGGNIWEMKDHMDTLHRGLRMIFELEVMFSHDELMLQLKDVRVVHATALPLPTYLVDFQPSWQLPLSWLMIHQVCPRKGKSHFRAPPSATPIVVPVWSKQWL